jgi:hypothetical protein
LLAPFLFAVAIFLSANSQVAIGEPFSHETVRRLAGELAAKAYEAPTEGLPKGAENLDYDEFRQIRFRRERTIWRGDGLKFELQVLPVGWLFKSPVEINTIDNGTVRALAPENGFFTLGLWPAISLRKIAWGSQASASPARSIDRISSTRSSYSKAQAIFGPYRVGKVTVSRHAVWL